MGSSMARYGNTNSTIHGDSVTSSPHFRLYRIWYNMLSRCRDETDDNYKDYMGRGIKVCEQWNDYATFKEWALSNGYKSNLTIDRKDNNGDYCPNNCRWATSKQQNRNKRNNRKITIGSETKTLSEWFEIYPMCRDTFYYRLEKGMTEEEALTTPLRRR